MKKIEYFIKINESKRKILFVLEGSKQNQAFIARYLNLSSSTVDRIIQELYMGSMVDFKVVDNRKVYFHTKEGKSMVKIIRKIEVILDCEDR